MRASILVVEDHAYVRQLLVETLTEGGGFVVCLAGTLGRAQAWMTQCGESFDLMVLDVGLPDGDGRNFCANLRQQGFSLPVIILSGLAQEDDVVRGFEAGADDYVVKPFSARELVARVRAQLRRSGGPRLRLREQADETRPRQAQSPLGFPTGETSKQGDCALPKRRPELHVVPTTARTLTATSRLPNLEFPHFTLHDRESP